MNRRWFVAGAAASLACARDKRPRLNVYNWSSYIDPAMIARFEQERGVRIRYGTYESNEEMLAKIVSGNSGWDIVFPTHSRLAPMARHGLIANLDHGLLPSLGCLDTRFQSPLWDPNLRWGVPYMWNATGVAYNSKETAEPHGWDFLWSPTLGGRMTMLDDPEDVIGACLQKLGYPFSSVDQGQLRAAQGAAVTQKKLLRAYINAEVRDQLVAGDVLAAQLWSTTAAQAIHAERKLDFVYPAEGYPLYCDCAVILAESRRFGLAHQFLNFLSQPDVAAANTAVAETAGTVTTGTTQRDRVLYPPDTVYNRGVWVETLSASGQEVRDRIWTEIKAS